MSKLTYNVTRFKPTEHEVQQMRLRGDIMEPILAWLKSRSAALQENEDLVGEWGDAAKQLHVRSFKGARMDCDDIRKELEAVIHP
jgi:hypothetical protein